VFVTRRAPTLILLLSTYGVVWVRAPTAEDLSSSAMRVSSAGVSVASTKRTTLEPAPPWPRSANCRATSSAQYSPWGAHGKTPKKITIQ
jgi:hypothetical protein